MSNTYKAKVLGAEREIQGFNEAGNLMLADGEEFVVTPFEMAPETFRSLQLWRISSLTFSGGKWLLDGESLKARSMREAAMARGEGRNGNGRTKAYTLLELCDVLEGRLPIPGNPSPQLSELKEKIVAVCWVQQRFDYVPGQTRRSDEKPIESVFGGHTFNMLTDEFPDGKMFEPVFLTEFRSIGRPAKPPPECFTSFAGAAKYAGVSDRTIKNWKQREWLKVEQHGRKIRIDRIELEKCMNRPA